jgi:hypothetical protein
MKKHLRLLVCGSCLLSACGGGSLGRSPGGGSPSVIVSPATLTFGDEVVSSVSQPLSIMLSNSGTATLSITNIASSTNFTETNNCGSSLASGANCAISVTFTPDATGSLNGTLSITDNAIGSPQTVSLSGTGAAGTTQETLTGSCWGLLIHGAPQQCSVAPDSAQCPAGQVAKTPTSVSGCLPPESVIVDNSTVCMAETSNGETVRGSCLVQVSDTGGSCSVQGQECGAAQLPPCCSGFTCVPASTRAYCQPQ